MCLLKDQLRKELNLLVDILKLRTGTSNTGNTARWFFSNPALRAAITVINKELKHRLDVLLSVNSSDYKIDKDAFDDYANKTPKVYIQNYNWYYMPASVQQLLIHGKKIIKNALPPIG